MEILLVQGVKMQEEGYLWGCRKTQWWDVTANLLCCPSLWRVCRWMNGNCMLIQMTPEHKCRCRNLLFIAALGVFSVYWMGPGLSVGSPASPSPSFCSTSCHAACKQTHILETECSWTYPQSTGLLMWISAWIKARFLTLWKLTSRGS